jgi:DNA-binding SARP family transcriptional activator
VWAEPPPSAKAQLHNLISALRRRVGLGELIVSRPFGAAMPSRRWVGSR